MIHDGHIVLFRFPQSDQAAGKLRPNAFLESRHHLRNGLKANNGVAQVLEPVPGGFYQEQAIIRCLVHPADAQFENLGYPVYRELSAINNFVEIYNRKTDSSARLQAVKLLERAIDARSRAFNAMDALYDGVHYIYSRRA